nr:nucleoside hydrolase [Rugamonas sp.]
MNPKKIIFDTDPGIDDAMALLFLSRAPQLQLLGITTAMGNGYIEATTRNALYLRDRFGLSVPVAQGASRPLEGEPTEPPTWVHGDNALGDIAVPADSASTPHALPAHRFLIDMIRSHPHEITIIAVARLTNLALALREAPEIAGLVKQVVVMGGAFGTHGHSGNVTPLAEANIAGDPLAAEEVFGAAWPLAIIGLDVTQQTQMDDAYLRGLVDDGGEAGQFIWDISRVYAAFHVGVGVSGGFYVHDSSAVAYAIDPTLFSASAGPVRVVTDGFAAGHTIQSRPGAWGQRPAVQVCREVDSARLLALYRRVLCAPPAR